MQKTLLLSQITKHFIKVSKLVLLILPIFFVSIFIYQLSFAFIDYKAILPAAPGYATIEVTPELLEALIQVESSNNPSAYNHYTKARGLTQITPIAWRELRKHYGSKYANLNFWEDMCKSQVAREAGTDYLYHLQKILKAKRIPVTLDNLLAAYVWGPNNLEKNGIHNAPRVVKNYVSKVKKLAQASD
ncbi:MAG: lytic transglycosylase domain-containing protein [Candidatus Omnitrophica bacterium]|nr:lytic transglycosylase domain-containing protein [Candidatus Omnitrophota bacterium]